LKDALDKGKGIKEDYIVKLKEIHQKLKDIKVDLGDHAKEVLAKLKDKVKEYWQKILEKLKPEKEAFYADDDEEANKLREKFNEILQKIKDAFDNRESIKANIITELKKIRDQMREKSIDLGDKAKELIEKLKEKATGFWKLILDKISKNSKRSVEDYDLLFADDDDIKTELGKKLKERFDEIVEKLKDALENGKGVREDTLNRLKELKEKLAKLKIDLGGKFKEQFEKLKEKAKDYWQKILDRLELKEQRSISEVFERVKNFFKDLNIELKEKFTKFGEWVKSQYEKGLEKGKDKLDNIKKIAKTFLDDSKKISKEVAEEALDFFRDYKEDLKEVYEDIKAKVKKIVNEH